ncbi:MAG: hypothetical protein WCB14_07640 [Candidatus Acidiferrales bacterium]
MNAREKKATRAAPPASLLVGWARQGMGSFMAAQRILLDLAAQENAMLLGMAREQFGKDGIRPAAKLVEMADTGVKNFTAAGKILLDLAAGETEMMVEGVKEVLPLPASAGVVADVVKHRVETLIGLQKELLDAAEEQTRAVAKSVRDGDGMHAMTHAAELARRGMEGFVESEKKFLDLAAHVVTTAAKGSKGNGKAPRDRMKVLTEMVKEGAEKYMGAQKKLLEMTLEQLETMGKAEHKKMEPKAGKSVWADLTEKSVKNVVTAEKSLLELAMKPVKEATHKAGPRPHGRRVHVGGHKAAHNRKVVAMGA